MPELRSLTLCLTPCLEWNVPAVREALASAVRRVPASRGRNCVVQGIAALSRERSPLPSGKEKASLCRRSSTVAATTASLGALGSYRESAPCMPATTAFRHAQGLPGRHRPKLQPMLCNRAGTFPRGGPSPLSEEGFTVGLDRSKLLSHKAKWHAEGKAPTGTFWAFSSQR
jgi:hypothetical protein